MERYRIHLDSAVYFLTYSVVEWLPVFIDEQTCGVVTDSLSFCHREKNLRVNAFVIMPTHLHMIAFDAAFDSTRLSTTLADFRKFTGRRLSDLCGRRFSPSFAEVLRERATADRERRFWQLSRHPEETEAFWRREFDYSNANPCRKGIVRPAEDWRFSSASYYHADGAVECDVPISALAW